MHPNPAFRADDPSRNIAFARSRAFGTLTLSTEDAPLISHVPFLLSEDGSVAELHLVRSNPIVRALSKPRVARIAVSGPDGYVSPDWYGIEDQVPTWNYIAVHLTGPLELRPSEALRDLLDRQSALFENQLAPKPAWTTQKMTPETLDRMMRMIVPCRMQVSDIQGTWKLNQNKPDPARTAASDQISKGIGLELEWLAALMRSQP